MKSLILRLVLIGLIIAVIDDDVLSAQVIQPRHLTEKETAEVKQKLEAFDEGNATLDSLTDNRDSTLNLLEYYSAQTNHVTAKMKLPISRSYALWGLFPQSAILAQEYVNVFSNDVRGWKVFGAAKVMMKSYDGAIEAYTNAVRLGDEMNFAGLGLAALGVNRLDILENIVVPHLLIQMNDVQKFPESERIQMRGCLIAYAIKADKKEIFIRAIAGVDISKLSQWPELKEQIDLGCRSFEGSDIAKIRQEMESTTSSTNSISSPPH